MQTSNERGKPRNRKRKARQSRRSSCDGPPVDPSEALECLHELMHQFDRRNHDECRGVITPNQTVNGLRFYSGLPGYEAGGYLGFGREFAELYAFEERSDDGPKSHLLKRFWYTEPKLIWLIVEALPGVGVVVPESLSAKIEDMQAALIEQAKERD